MITDYLLAEEKKLLKTIHFKASEILFYENDICDSIGIVLEGEIKISSMTFEGNEIIYNTLTKGSIFGNNLLFSNDNKYRGDVRAVTKGSLYIINKNNLVKLLMNNESFLKHYLAINSEFSKSLNTKIKLLSFNHAKERFLYYLFIHNNRIAIKSVTDLANQLYLTREVTSRLLSSLIKEKVINKEGNIITLIDK